MKGAGTITVASAGGRGGGAETAPVKEGDAIPIQLSEMHSVENKGTEPLEFLGDLVQLFVDVHESSNPEESTARHHAMPSVYRIHLVAEE